MREKWKSKNTDVYVPESASDPSFIACGVVVVVVVAAVAVAIIIFSHSPIY